MLNIKNATVIMIPRTANEVKTTTVDEPIPRKIDTLIGPSLGVAPPGRLKQNELR